MGKRITDLDGRQFKALFENFQYTAYRLETLQRYDVGYEDGSYRAFLAGEQMPPDQAKNEWTAMIRHATEIGKTFKRVRIVTEPLTDYTRYELEWSYGPNVQAGEDIRVLSVHPDKQGLYPIGDYWLFDSLDLWLMEYGRDGQFLYAERVDDSAAIVRHSHWRDAALHYAIPYADYMRSRELIRAS